jgi:hypothetical protein
MKIELDPEGIARVLGEQPAIEALHELAEGIVTEAVATGPRHHAPHEIDKIAVGETRTSPQGAVVEIDWDSHVWHLIEFGSINNPPYRPLTRAAQHAGLTFRNDR